MHGCGTGRDEAEHSGKGKAGKRCPSKSSSGKFQTFRRNRVMPGRPRFMDFLKASMFFAEDRIKGKYHPSSLPSGRLIFPDQGCPDKNDVRPAIRLPVRPYCEFGSRPVRPGGWAARGSNTLCGLDFSSNIRRHRFRTGNCSRGNLSLRAHHHRNQKRGRSTT